ncbi:MAG TPA: hypothetical protein VNG71_06710 [Pyrinomonadaceae bacterium]|nr:hypothetical protein [Pyrinomonadaceae bacterium]
MSNNPTPDQEPEVGSPTQTSPSAQSVAATEAEKKKALTEAINNILKGIPFIGPYIVIIKLKWGWTGILLLFGGFLIAATLVGTGLYPEFAMSSRYFRTAHDPIYRVVTQKDMNWQAALGNAKSRIRASGVALSNIDPKLVTDKIKAGANVQLVYVNPCAPAVQQRQADEHNPHASTNIALSIKKLGDFSQNLSPAEKQALNVMLTDAYPTMVVTIIDDDLYAYFCPYRAECSTSPVLIFDNYHEKDAARFFENHFLMLLKDATTVSDLKQPCGAPTPGSSGTPTPGSSPVAATTTLPTP